MSQNKNFGRASSRGICKGKRIGLLALLCTMLVCSLIFLTACSRETLATPTDLSVDDTMRLTWSEVVNSTGGYAVEVDGVVRSASTTEFYLSALNLEAGDHAIRVKALTIDANYFLDSEWSDVYTYSVRAEDVGLAYKLINNASEYEVKGSGTLSGNIVVPDTYNNKPVTSIGNDAFAHSSQLTSITLGKNIKRIGYQAFYSCSNLASVSLSEGLEEIGEAAFLSCSSLKEIDFPETLKTIDDRAFVYCSSLKEIEIPDSVAYLGERAFEAASALEKVVIGDGITTLYKATFYDCKKLSDVTLGNNIIYITQNTFKDCVMLMDIEIPASMQTIEFQSFAGSGIYKSETDLFYADDWLVGFDSSLLPSEASIADGTAELVDISIKNGTVGIANAALSGFTNAKSIIIPPSVTKMGTGAFFGCLSLVEVEIPSSIKNIPNSAFSDCYALEKVVISEGVTSIGNQAFTNCVKLTDATLPKAIGEGKGISLPSTLTRIGHMAFLNTLIYNSDGRTSRNIVYVGKWLVNYVPHSKTEENPVDTRTDITIKKDTVGIADNALNFFTSITEIKFDTAEEGFVYPLEHIGEGAFANCTSLNLFPSFEKTLVTELRARTFFGCTGLSMITVPDTITSIGESVFEGCGSAGSFGFLAISLPTGITTIPKRAFARSSLAVFIIPSTVTTIEEEAFNECYVLSSINIPDHVTRVGANAFQQCLTLTTVTLSANLTEIEDSVFRDCINLQKIIIPQNVTRIGNHAFRGCETLANVTIPASVTEIGGHAFRDCTMFTAIVIPNTVTKLGNYAFAGCSNARSVSIGSGIDSLGVGLFEQCMVLSSVSIPDTINNIGDYAFRDCERLGAIIISKNIKGMGRHVFEGASVTIYSEPMDVKGWDEFWNSTGRPVFWGCTLSDDRTYVASFVKFKNAISNEGLFNISLPTRSGFNCQGWSDGTTHYSVLRVDDVALDMTLFTVWRAA